MMQQAWEEIYCQLIELITQRDQSQLYKIENLSGIPIVRQIKSIIGESNSQNSYSKLTVNPTFSSYKQPFVYRSNQNEPQDFKEAAQRILTQDCFQIQNQLLLITNQKYLITAFKSSNQISLLNYQGEGQSNSVKITHVQKNEYLINYFENLQVLDFDETKIKSNIYIDSNHDNSILSNHKEKIQKSNSIQIDTKPDLQQQSPRMLVHSLILRRQQAFFY
ncbi:hypothetical protein TTHERM_00248490 (macronuclear) [Tetrahymena thermophila SB210]|uniref:Uncharacterized protein n=1 Tax=Tetrahymena thermophila (strain SB210) TaxID=312017 RepID=Q245J9_TETTS|nr:hypothetical protein TTHERM_00248490 [Tetrahymena thermophila SB210]EAS03633.1 hypothetical protein TTHERM_00248490 [Tetrahymena thermophila SB210]|eukprot:XP_001023879.1 hypothetical protein TTHERM_00248490 [Tetrahymena thermophila SB210]